MKVVILAGGRGTRMLHETEAMPKALIEIHGLPLIEHVLQIYIKQGFFDFIICGGYKFSELCAYFQKRESLLQKINNPQTNKDKINLQVVDTGLETQTAGRLFLIKELLQRDSLQDDHFLLTYCDGLSDLDLQQSVAFHQKKKKLVTMTVVHPPSPFGVIEFNEHGDVVSFKEKPQQTEQWINGGFFIVNKDVLNLIHRTDEIFEIHILERLARESRLSAFRHKGYWFAVDTLRDKHFVEAQFNNIESVPWLKK